MNTIVKDGLIFLGGLATGVLASYIFIKKKFEIISEEEIDSVRDYYAKRYPDEITDGVAVESTDSAPSEYRKDSEQKIDISEGVRQERGKRKTIDYTSYYNSKNEPSDPAESEHPEDDDYDRDYEEGLKETKERQSAREPRIIKAGDFESVPGYSSETLLFYAVNKVLTTEGDEVLASQDLDEVADMLGHTLTKYGFYSNDEPRLYVRNEKRGCDYEIIKVFDAFEEV